MTRPTRPPPAPRRRLLPLSPLAAAALACACVRAVAPPRTANAGMPEAPAAPAAADPSLGHTVPGALHFAIIGDYGQDGPDEARVAALVHAMRPEFIATVGDNNYGQGAAETIDANIGRYYHDFIAFDPAYAGPYRRAGASDNRFFPVLGNHDWNTPGAVPYLAYFALPGNERYYQVRRGPVEIFALDSDAREPDGIDAHGAQARWLQAALAASRAPWKMVLLHHPPYSRGHHGNTPVLQWPFAAWGAHIVLAGHDHHYERLVVDGLTYVVTGAGGARLRAVDGPAIPGASVDVVYDARHGALQVDASAAALEFRYFNDRGELVDRFALAAAG